MEVGVDGAAHTSQAGGMICFDGVQVFSATKANDRAALGETITQWMQQHQRSIEVVDRVVTQSSDSEFHCLTITLFWCHRRPAGVGRKK